MQHGSASVSKYSKDLQCRSLHRLKRERPSDAPQVSKGVPSYEVTRVVATVSSSTVSDSKRPRLHSFSKTQSEKLGLKLSGRISHVVLEECLKCTENGDKLG
uniref:Uncharacterized protein n=4 Tax=Brugia TaxID=6278 RepID=A8QBX2_BRUMA